MTTLEVPPSATQLPAGVCEPASAVTGATRLWRRARAEQLDEIRRVLDAGTWYRGGYRSPAAWLTDISGEAYGQCTLALHLAKTIVKMPTVQAAFAAGDLPESALRLLADTWTARIADVFARDEELLVRWATTLPLSDFKIVLDTWRMNADPDREERTAQERFDQRSVHLSPILDGVGRLDGTMDPDGHRTLKEALRVLGQPTEGETRTAAQRRHDALVHMARMALGQLQAEPDPTPRRLTPTVTGTATVTNMTHNTGGGRIDTGGTTDVVPIETIRRMGCDCDLHRLLTDPAGHIIDYGRRRRLVSDAQFELLVIRDHGCRWPGCTIPAAACDAHHAIHWLDHGETEPDNLVLLCWYHHHLLHEQHWSMTPLGAGHFQLNDPSRAERPIRPPLIGTTLPLDIEPT